MTRSNISPELYAKLLNCQASSSSVERSFSMLQKLLSNDRHFSPDNVWKYLGLYSHKSHESVYHSYCPFSSLMVFQNTCTLVFLFGWI